MGKQPLLFCDFDGTVTKSDNIVAIMKHFNPPGWKSITADILGQKLSVKAGVGKLFSLLPSSQKQEFTDFVLGQAVIRDGFAEFVHYTREHRIPLLIVSGGIDFFVKPILEPYQLEENIYCNGSDFTRDTITITWPHPCKTGCDNECGLCKVSILNEYNSEVYEKIVIGDSITDLAAAKRADFVIARDFLLEKCESLRLAHQSFETFYDVIDILSWRGESID
ncbi:MAG: 2-hydroxy-3-keto-5-methylthiopentenyl-1-phosphate phosphatase [Bacilli bacterium]